MATMTHRTTFALDEVTIKRLKKLASGWNTSQSEVIRRSIAQMEEQMVDTRRDPLELLAEYHAHGGLDATTADNYLQQVAEDRSEYRGGE